jgi:hypothetical protein
VGRMLTYLSQVLVVKATPPLKHLPSSEDLAILDMLFECEPNLFVCAGFR